MSRVITQKSSGTTQSMLVKATKDWSEDLKKFSIEPKGVFGSTATVKCGIFLNLRECNDKVG